jgi:hypothetical protein
MGNRLVVLAAIVACGHPSPPPPQPINHPPPNPAGTPPAPSGDAVLAWPVAPFTAAQIAEVKSCDIGKLAPARYPKAMAVDALAGAFARHGTCDDATFAAACAAHVGDGTLPAACLDAYRAAVKANPAFAFHDDVTGGYFGKLAIVAPPPVAAHALASVVIAYEWGGLGTPVKWTITAKDLASHPTLDITGPNAKPGTWSTEVAANIAALGTSLASFLPIKKPLNAIDCTDNYPEWTATLAFDDGTKLELTTERSNLIGLGGPWQTTIGGVTYLQLSPDFVRAIAKLVKALGLPIGEPQGEMCRGYDLQAEALAP